ncbi:CRISPR-associated endonuclease Cas6 [Catalinimonas sp. 4WD22]|uniref:CRISPR-associated endonuclease Cas6 n=1 Tax=Catalinimonas locisalis TaxID=3133978 RepID=UPI003101A29E
MKKLKYLRVEFEGDIRPHEIPAFRGAVIDKVGREHDIFHNHNKLDGHIYRYPLVQYKSIRKHPSLLCIDFGVEEIHHFFQNKDWSIELSGRKLNMSISQLDMKQYNLQTWDKLFHYNIRNWIALSQESYKDYQQFENLTDRIRFLETKLIGNILSFAKGVDWHVDKQIEAHIQDLKEPRWVSLKGKKVLGFNLDFSSNVFLPNFIGLGKSVSLGYGTVVQKKP